MLLLLVLFSIVPTVLHVILLQVCMMLLLVLFSIVPTVLHVIL